MCYHQIHSVVSVFTRTRKDICKFISSLFGNVGFPNKAATAKYGFTNLSYKEVPINGTRGSHAVPRAFHRSGPVDKTCPWLQEFCKNTLGPIAKVTSCGLHFRS